MALQPAYGSLADWWQSLADDPVADALAIASAQGVPAPGPITTPLPPEIEMPAENARPTIGFPRAVEPAEIEMAGTDFAAERAATQAQQASMPSPVPMLGQSQPGLGVPISVVDSLPPMPDPMGAHEAAVDTRIDGSFDQGLPETELRSRFEEVSDARKGMSSLQAAEDNALQQQLTQERTSADMLKAATREREDAEAAQQGFMESRARARHERMQIDAEAKDLAQQKVGASDWYDEGGIGRTVSAMLLGFAGGLVQHLNGGRNIGLEAVDRSINQFIAARQQDRAHQREMLGERRRSLGDQQAQDDADYRKAQVFRKASYERALRQIEVEQQNYDPEGNRARVMDNTRREMMSKMAADEIAAEQARAKLLEEQAKVRREEQRLALDRIKSSEDIRHNKASERNTAYGISSENKRAKDRLALDEKKLNQEAKKLEADGKKEQAKLIRERAIGGELREVKDDQGNVVGTERGLVTQKDDTIFIPQGSEGEIAKLRDTKSASDFVVDVLDRVRRRRTGWTSDFAKSDENQQLKADWAAAKVIAKDVLGLGALSGPDEALIDNFLGTDDPTQWRDPTAGIEASRRNVLGIYNSRARVLGADKEYAPPDTAKLGKAKDMPGDADLRELLEADWKRMPIDRIAAEVGATPDDVRGNQSGLVAKVEAAGGTLPSFQRTVDGWKQAAQNSGDPAIRKVAIERLEKVANESQDKVLRDLASRALATVATLPDEAEETRGRADNIARDTISTPKGGR
jgi:hypothetical protein